ncbi:unnamed protein product (macronuclear) [Paramecium tetraurelia]|uniref:Uncharacterized protein n=1 Tax=Paramecium tetraurelia TaxID=5888 RepID=A0D4I6_PARTE|nr:uncharacterized protein GSPATT00013419001 [Paramecium tetraurelia]CAK77953.1 unnamed protein product [Paramecium tetraurelia]|eukprot:XP_001445350.1 hypothetical protein (macronuclear) [Paramecium tetraurelia strain d4-2]
MFRTLFKLKNLYTEYKINIEVVQIRNYLTGAYLTATGFNTQEKGLLFGSTVNVNNYYVVGSDDPDNYYTLWTIVKVFDDSNRISYGDVVYFKNLSTKMYLIYEFQKHSEVTNQIRVSLNQTRLENYPFILQQLGEQIFQTKNHAIQNGVPLKIQTTKLIDYLETSQKNYTFKQINQFKEVSCGKESEYNNWQIIKLTPEKLSQFQIQPTLEVYDEHQRNLG